MNHFSINWPNALSEKVFKQKYWQKKPVLIRNFFSKNIAKNLPDHEVGNFKTFTN